MSKAISNHFHGTTGERRFQMAQEEYEDDIIKERVQGLNLREHLVKHKSSLSIKEIKRRINNRTATMQGHHTYSVSHYPHLAGNHKVIYPVSFEEHLYEWHGGNFKNSLPGKPFKRKRRT